MGSILIDSGDYAMVRAALDVALDETKLPDTTITLDIYLGAAEREAKSRDSSWASREDDELAQLKAATAYLTAARMVYAVIPLTAISAQTRDISYSRPAWDAEKKRADLMAMAESEFNELLTPSETAPDRVSCFAGGKGRRGIVP
jgi:hypothetical protein